MPLFVQKIERVFVYIVLDVVVDKTRLPVSRRLGPFPEFVRGKMDKIGWWLVAGSLVLSTTWGRNYILKWVFCSYNFGRSVYSS